MATEPMEYLNRFIAESKQIVDWQNEIQERAIAKKARTILMAELRNEQSQENAKTSQLKVNIARLQYNYDHEAVLKAITALTATVQPAVQDRRDRVKAQLMSRNQTRQ
jgi:hypothetical protein